MTESRLREVIRETVSETLITIGISDGDPLEMQKDMSHLREWRLAMEKAKNRGFLAIVTCLVSGALGLLAMGLHDWVAAVRPGGGVH